MIIGFQLTSCVGDDEFPLGKKLVCDAETLNKEGENFIVKGDKPALFEGGHAQTDKESHSGKYSVLTSPNNKYSLTYEIKRTDADWYFRVSVWRKSKNGGGLLVASGENSNQLYESTNRVIETGNDGWERLEIDVFTPLGFRNDKVKFYVWNNTPDTVYFDDLTIERLKDKQYPDYQMEFLSIYIDTSDFAKLQKNREQAFANGILQSSNTDWVKGIISDRSGILKAKLRLKGDWLDHLKGRKWSYRIKLKKSYAWNQLRTFSIQNPMARGFLYEWLSHQIFDHENLLTTRYGFIPVLINNESMGLYAWEEHFEKQLLESRKRREGPILKFSEDALWQSTLVSAQRNSKNTLPFYETSMIVPFSEGSIAKNKTLFNEFLNGQKLMKQYKDHSKEVSEIFDVDKLAKYFALLDLTKADHSRAWHNQRFYFNPVLCKLEPILFDGFGDLMTPYYGLNNNRIYHFLKYRKLDENEFDQVSFIFKDKGFTDRYFIYLKQYSEEKYIDSISNLLQDDLVFYDSIMKPEFPYYTFDKLYLQKSAEDIRNYMEEWEQYIHDYQSEEEINIIPYEVEFDDPKIIQNTPEYFVNVYQKSKNNDSLSIDVHNYYPRSLIILGTGQGDKYVDFYEHPEPEMKAFVNEPEILSLTTDTLSRYLFFMVKGHNETFRTAINFWPYPEGETAQQKLMSHINLEDKYVFEKVTGKDLYIRKGSLTVDHPLIIPTGYTVHFKAGTQINLVKNAMFISYSPLIMLGTENDPITITSSDFSANGFTILQAEGLSRLNHVRFENLNTLDYEGWTLTGSVTFYESDVQIRNTSFYRNQCEDALNTVRSGFNVEHCSFDYIYGDAFDSDFCTGELKSTTFTSIGNDAIDFSGSHIKIKDVQIDKASDKGISGGEESYLYVENTTITNSNIGIASKDLSVVEVTNCVVSDCNYGFVLLQKKPEYGPGTMIIKQLKTKGLKTNMLIEKGSNITLDGILIEGKKEKLADIFYQ